MLMFCSSKTFMNRHVTKLTTTLFCFFSFSIHRTISTSAFPHTPSNPVILAWTRKIMNRGGSNDVLKTAQLSRQRSIQLFIFVVFLYVVFVNVQMPLMFETRERDDAKMVVDLINNNNVGDGLRRNILLENENANGMKKTDFVSFHPGSTLRFQPSPPPETFESSIFVDTKANKIVSGLVAHFSNHNISDQGGLQNAAKCAWDAGVKIWDDIQSDNFNIVGQRTEKKANETCPYSISVSGEEFVKMGRILKLPCGIALGSHITVVAKPKLAHLETDTKIGSGRNIMVSQFLLELQGLKTADNEDPPRIFHLNPRLKGDWSGKPVIEMNTCYRMQWGTSQRCQGSQSVANEKTVDGQVKCEKWSQKESDYSDPSKTNLWMNRLVGKRNANAEWPFPFAEDKTFVLTLSAGFDGYHLNVNGRHISSFPYRTNFAIEDATGLSINGDIDVHSVHIASLPTSHPSSGSQMHLEMVDKWKAPLFLDEPVELFIGILSAGNHFAERMAVRKSWMQHSLIRSSRVVARFFVALHERKEVNLELKKEAEYFGDIVIVPYMDAYDLVVLKTVAICEYGVRTLSAQSVMKCDDDTFVRVDVVYNGARKLRNESFYAGNINYHHKPLRAGKWAVTNKEWAEEDYPAYANGPGYLLSSDIAKYVVTEFDKNELRLFKMEDVSVGMWVEKFNNSVKPVKYVHSLKFCQFGCVQNYYTAHYQSPRQMMCLWQKLMYYGKPQCCNM